MTPPLITSRVTHTAWTGDDLFGAFEFASRWLDHHRESINALNVFPVPDGDTGTNMTMTMRSSIDRARSAGQGASAGEVARLLAFGALMGAQGNSGVILSQILRGFSGAIVSHSEITGQDFARALDDARQMAYQAVISPVEGTMLSVIRAAAAHATTASETASLPAVLEQTLAGARQALEQTTDQLEDLRRAGVVDAGGAGIVYLLEGLCRFSRGETDIQDDVATSPTGAAMRFLDDIADTHGEAPFGYCTNFMIFGKHLDFLRVRDVIAGMGQSAVIVGDDSLVKVHIHTEHPGSVLEYALTIGSLDQIKIDNMTLQTETLSNQRAKARRVELEEGIPVVDGAIGIVAVASGDGIAAALESMGANFTVSGGQSMNPSTEDLLNAVRRMPVDQVIILPNNKNVVMTANLVDSLTDKTVRVVPSRSVPQGLAALARFSREASLDDNTSRMTTALGDAHTIEITHAVQAANLNGVVVAEGDLLSLVDGQIVASGVDLDAIVSQAMLALESSEPELLTVFTGEDATPDATSIIERLATSIFPDAELEIVEGDQPIYPYIIAVE